MSTGQAIWHTLSATNPLYCAGLGFTERHYINNLYALGNPEPAYDVATHGDGEWWIVPYEIYEGSLSVLDRYKVGPFSSAELGMAAAEILTRDGVALFEQE